jgi:hypothetical protein
MVAFASKSTGTDQTTGNIGVKTSQPQGILLERTPPQRRERMMSSTGQLISPGRVLNSIEELDHEDEDWDGMTDRHGQFKWSAYCPVSEADKMFGGVGTSVLPALFLVDDVLAERVGGTIETAAGRKLGSFRLGMKTLREKALECQVLGKGTAPGTTHYSMAAWVTIKSPPPSLHLRLMHQSKDPMADPITGGALTLTIEVTGAFALPSDGHDISDPYCTIQLLDNIGNPVGQMQKTQIIDNSLDPFWGEKFSFSLGKGSGMPPVKDLSLIAKIMDRENICSHTAGRHHSL